MPATSEHQPACVMYDGTLWLNVVFLADPGSSWIRQRGTHGPGIYKAAGDNAYDVTTEHRWAAAAQSKEVGN